jgi:hydrogenase maturation factor HypE
MLNGAKSPVGIRGFHNENLNGDLIKHKKVMEVLGTTAIVSSTDKQLSGLGFNATVRDELVVKLGGTHKRMVKIKF